MKSPKPINHNIEKETVDAAPEGSGLENSASILNEAADILRNYYGAAMESLFIDKLVVGVFFTGVKLSNGCGGVAYTPPETIRNASRRILRGSSSAVCGMSADTVISGNIPNPFADVIRLATINALSVPVFEDGRYILDQKNDLADLPHLFAGRRICMVGAIIPLLKRLKELSVGEIKVIDSKKDSKVEVELACGEFISPEHTVNVLARCETAIFTGAAIANGSIEHLLSLTPRDAAVAVVGPTAGFIPEPLFRRNVAAVGTAMVTDIDTALEIIAEGGGAYRFFGGCVRKINLLNRKRLEQLKLGNK
ncbi:MAG: DUF364 domain-containing protein [Smithella sp.]